MAYAPSVINLIPEINDADLVTQNVFRKILKKVDTVVFLINKINKN
jgi:hypothetical protein